MAEHGYETTDLDDLLGVAPGLVNDARLYRAFDLLGAHKDARCANVIALPLVVRRALRVSALRCDEHYFEGHAERNPQAQRGYSRDRRGDCKQVCIGLVCTPKGLPLSFETFACSRTDVTTVEEIVASMETKYGMDERIWVMDRGMVSEANIAFLRRPCALCSPS